MLNNRDKYTFLNKINVVLVLNIKKRIICNTCIQKNSKKILLLLLYYILKVKTNDYQANNMEFK